MCFKQKEGETPSISLFYFVFFKALVHLMRAQLWFVGNNSSKPLCFHLESRVLQGGTAGVAPGESCGVGAIAQLSSGVYGVRDRPLQIRGLKPWYGGSI